jgi:hypothetical protein
LTSFTLIPVKLADSEPRDAVKLTSPKSSSEPFGRVAGSVIVPLYISVMNLPSFGGFVIGSSLTDAPPSLAVTVLPDGACTLT